tara:strand:+ start:238 stop:621 length:384 start_codon:yes stop_codon:yes gene_type:complete
MKEEYFVEIDFILSLLKSNNKKIFNEIILAKKNKMWATTIVFSMVILDNIFNDDYYADIIDGLEINNLKYSKDLIWLRKRRNQILHFENLEDNSSIILSDQDLKINSEKAYNILIKSLIKLFPQENF